MKRRRRNGWIWVRGGMKAEGTKARGDIFLMWTMNTQPGYSYKISISVAWGTQWVLVGGGQDMLPSHSAALSHPGRACWHSLSSTLLSVTRWPQEKGAGGGRTDCTATRIWPCLAYQHSLPKTLNERAGLAMKMSSLCITLQGSASNSWKWLIAGQLWSSWNRNQSTYWQFRKKGHASALRHFLHSWTCLHLSITPSSALRKIVLNGKCDGGTGAWSLQSYLFISLKEEL